MKKFTLLFLAVIFASALFAQTPLQLADTAFFKNKDYYTSTKLYNKALKKATPDQTKYIYYQIGECYRLGNNYEDAKKTYETALNSGYDQPIINLHLGEVLLLSGDYTSAKTYLEKYLLAVPNDNIAKMRIEACELNTKGQTVKPRHEIKNETGLNSKYSDYGIAYFSSKVIFASTRMEGSGKYDPTTAQGFSDLFESTYDATKAAWSKPEKIKGSVNTGYNEGTFSFDAVNKIAYYSQCNGASGKQKQCNIMTAKYNDANNTWSESTIFPFNSQDFRTQQQSITADGNTLYFSSDMPGGQGGADIYKIKKVNGVWGQPENLGTTINTVGNEMFPFISGDTLLVFASDGLPGFGGLDIFTSALKNGAFAKPVNMLKPFNSTSDDFNMVFKDSKDHGYFCSNRPGGQGDDDIYSYDLIPVVLCASGTIRDKATNKPLDNATALIKGNDGSVDSVYTDSKGKYEYCKLKQNVKYSIKAEKDGYLNDSKTLTVGPELYSKNFNIDNGTDLDFALIKMTKEEIKIDNIYYDYDKADLRPESKLELDKLVNILKETPEIKLQISSHTDERGAKDYNIDLSQRRAQSVVDYLIANGINKDRLIAKGYGFSLPIVKNAKTEEEHQMNRRTTFKILNMQ